MENGVVGSNPTFASGGCEVAQFGRAHKCTF